MQDKPLILAFDTSAAHCAAALSLNDRVLDAVCEPMKKGQNERLIGLLEDLMARHSVEWSDLDALGVGVGPGNFTGIRIGISAARGLSLGLDTPAYGVNGFQQREQFSDGTSLICVPGPRDHQYVQCADGPKLMAQDDIEMLGSPVTNEPRAEQLVSAIAIHAFRIWPSVATPPAPLYLKPADAAPARNAPPRILDDA